MVFVEIGIAMPFMPVWLNAPHCDAGRIGGLLVLPIAIRIVATAPLTELIDRGLSARSPGGPCLLLRKVGRAGRRG